MVNPNAPLFEIFIQVTKKNDLAALELRKLTTDKEIIKKIIVAAHNGQPIILLPKFDDKLYSLSRLCQVGIIKYNFEDDRYYFLI